MKDNHINFSAILSDTPENHTTNLPPYSNLTNGYKVCSAHELMIKVLDKQDRKLDQIDEKLDTLLKEKAVRDEEEKKKEKKEDRTWSTRDKITTGVIVGVLVIVIGLVIEFNWKTFVLGI